MPPPTKSLKWVYLTVFATGLFSLVYQIAWQRYLTFLVGADSRSSVLILTVFLTALSVGYWLAGIYSERIKSHEIRFYGWVEILIGLWAVMFPFLFHYLYISISYLLLWPSFDIMHIFSFFYFSQSFTQVNYCRHIFVSFRNPLPLH